MNWKECREELSRELAQLICRDYILLDLPYFGNVGDTLIWQSALDILAELPHKCLYSAAITTYKKPKIKPDTIIVFMGGGNFGDIWERHQIFRHRVMADFPHNPIVQLPQSVWFNSADKLAADVECFARHEGPVAICCRERQSFDLIAANYKGPVRPLLLPDMVLGLNVGALASKLGVALCDGSGNLFVKRTDCEASVTADVIQKQVPDDAYVGDWPSMCGACAPFNRYWAINARLARFKKFYNYEDLAYKRFLKNVFLKSGMEFIAGYRTCFTTRLHCGILAALMGKEVVMFDNSYKKISGVYDEWMTDMGNVRMVRS